jgi:hypothetical protein
MLAIKLQWWRAAAGSRVGATSCACTRVILEQLEGQGAFHRIK